jgi:hypothetical protein
MQQNCASGVINRPQYIPPNILTDRVLFGQSEFHCGPKRATTWAGAQVWRPPRRSPGRGRRKIAEEIKLEIAVRGLDAGSNTQGDVVSAPEANPA